MSRENSQKGFRFGSRRSLLAKAQTQWVIERLLQTQPHLNLEVVEIVTEGDRVLEQPLSTMAGKGVFVKEIEDKLLAGDVDFAVHSMKDLPTESVPGLITGAIPERVDPRDVLISRLHANLEDMPEGANIGTGSFRRKAQLLHFRPDLNVVDMRGNINTRLQKAQSPDFDGIILAAAGLTRMGWLDRIQQFLSCEIMIPAVGQGALSIQVREDDRAARKLIAPLNDLKTETAVNAERLFLHKMGGGCQTPMGAFCQVRGDQVVLQGFCAEEDGSAFIKKQFEGPVEQALDLAARLAERLLEKSPGNS